MMASVWYPYFLLVLVQVTSGVKFINVKDLLGENVELFIPTLYSENERCQKHSEYYLQALKNFRLWATEMMDATAKFPNGALYGSTYNLGNFDQCLKIKVPYANDEFSGKYCLAKFTVTPPAYIDVNQKVDYIHGDYTSYFNTSTWEKVMAFSQDEFKVPRNVLYFAFCLPSSCTNEDLKKSLSILINGYNNVNDFKLIVDVQKRSCQTEEENNLTAGDIALIVVVLTFLILVALSSMYHLITSTENMKDYRVSGKFQAIIMCFSFPNNLKNLASTGKNEDGLNCVSGIKTLLMFCIILGHRSMSTSASPTINPIVMEESYTKPELALFLSGIIIVSTFFTMSGFLGSYFTIKSLEKQKFGTNIFRTYRHRIIRMVPSYALVMAFYCTLYIKLGSGPLWQENVGLEQERCIENWWVNLLYLSNYVNVDKLCMFQSWYLSCDMHYFLLTPPLLWLLQKNQTLGILTIGGVVAASVVSTFVTVYITNDTGVLLLYLKLFKDPSSNKTFRIIYIPSHLKASPYFVGVMAAYIKCKINSTNYKISKRALCIGWILCVFMIIIIIHGGYIFYIPEYSRILILSAFYASLRNFIFSICMAWIIIVVSSGNARWFEPILCFTPLTVLSKITYTVFLTHGAIQIMTNSLLRTPRYVSVFTMIYDTGADLSFVYFISFFLSICFEIPIRELERTIFSRDRPHDLKTNNQEYVREQLLINTIKNSTIADD